MSTKKQILNMILTAFLLLPVMQEAFAQKPFTDYKPSYEKWKDIYILDRIEYTKSRTIFHFRFIDKDGGYAVFYGPGENDAWFLRDTEDEKNIFSLLEIRNIAVNDIVRKKILNTKASLRFDSKPGDIFTCEVHFRRLPNDIKTAHLIEGIGKEENANHFNCFKIKLKTSESGELGSTSDMYDRIIDFEEQASGVLAEKMLELINEIRTEGCRCGPMPIKETSRVKWDSLVAKTAKRYVVELWATDGMTDNVDGKNTLQRLRENGHKTIKAFESIQFGATTPEKAFRGWVQTANHCLKLMDPKVKAIGAARKGKYWSLVLIY